MFNIKTSKWTLTVSTCYVEFSCDLRQYSDENAYTAIRTSDVAAVQVEKTQQQTVVIKSKMPDRQIRVTFDSAAAAAKYAAYISTAIFTCIYPPDIDLT
jgi:hypothetical protein